MEKRIHSIIASVVFYLSTNATVIASTKVGNGGDIIDAFLAHTYLKIGTVVNNLATQEAKPLDCSYLDRLSEKEADFCTQSLALILPGLAARLSATPREHFVLSTEPLFVNFPDRSRREVLAATPCGAKGDITFYYNGIKQLSPAQMFTLMTHELIHKVAFGNRPCIEDNDELGPFKGREAGRRLVDAMAQVLTDRGVEQGEVFGDFGIKDHFSCEITDLFSGVVFPSIASSVRVINRSGAFPKYFTGVENLPRDGNCALFLNSRRIRVSMRVLIVERADCEDPREPTGRSSSWQLTKEESVEGSSPNEYSIKILDREIMEGLNPLCSWQKEDVTFSADYQAEDGKVYRFAVKYLSSSAFQSM
jgi:hypothetical protein